MDGNAIGEGGALRGLRLLTIDRGPEGFGFHMYTNKQLKVSRLVATLAGFLWVGLGCSWLCSLAKWASLLHYSTGVLIKAQI